MRVEVRVQAGAEGVGDGRLELEVASGWVDMSVSVWGRREGKGGTHLSPRPRRLRSTELKPATTTVTDTSAALLPPPPAPPVVPPRRAPGSLGPVTTHMTLVWPISR